ncbi:MAG: hypothetical protein VST69_00145 [Nitrospirota bacterium]|nr:hypothetical protein [Nitrospirota bacterium]
MKGFRSPCLLILFLLILTMVACSRSGTVLSGATQETVEKALGKPDGFHRRWMPNKETREVWVYHEKGSVMKNHLYPDTHVIVFSNGKVVATNPKNPYAPLKE